MPPELPSPIPVVGQLISALVSFLRWESIQNTINNLVDFLSFLIDWLHSLINGITLVFWNVSKAWHDAIGYAQDTGGAIQGIGIDSWAMWHHLRYVLMPNTINWVLDWVYVNWISPLRKHLRITVLWAHGWHHWNAYYTWLTQNWALRWFRIGREHRAHYVYPQLQFLLTPRQVAHNYTQAFLTTIVRYLNYPGHREDRDGIARVVATASPRVWRYVLEAAADILERPMDSYGRGAALPQEPPDSNVPIPVRPPTWETWLGTLEQPQNPGEWPRIPELDARYDRS